MMFFAYVILLHFWVLFVLEMSGAQEFRAEEVKPPELIIEQGQQGQPLELQTGDAAISPS